MSQMNGKTRAILALGVLLAFAVALDVVLYLMWDKQYRQHAEVLLDPLGISTFPVGDDPAERPSSLRVVFFGDSRAQNWSKPAGLPPGVRIINRGIGNQTTPQILGRFDRHVAPLHPRVVVLELGVNDLTKVAVFPKRHGEIVAECEKNIDEIVARARALGATVVLTTIFPIGELPFYRLLFWSKEVDDAIAAVNAHLRGLAQPGVLLLDAGPLLVDSRGVVRPEFSFDFLHLNATGYAALNRGLVPIVTKALR
jgi:lysophospholipase L1-like esterase